MRPWLLVLSLLAFSVALSSAQAQQVAPWQLDPPPALQPAVIVAPPPAVEPLSAVGPQQWMDIEVLLGLPTALRVQRAVFRHDDHALLLEGLVGFDIIIPLAGVGARYRFAPYNGERNAFVLKPGLDAYFLVNPFAGLFGSAAGAVVGGADVECLWYHTCGDSHRFGWELGIDLGVLFGSGAFPIVSGIGGIHF
jgi:hypothetical protein